jgi:hypothetical protein
VPEEATAASADFEAHAPEEATAASADFVHALFAEAVSEQA